MSIYHGPCVIVLLIALSRMCWLQIYHAPYFSTTMNNFQAALTGILAWTALMSVVQTYGSFHPILVTRALIYGSLPAGAACACASATRLHQCRRIGRRFRTIAADLIATDVSADAEQVLDAVQQFRIKFDDPWVGTLGGFDAMRLDDKRHENEAAAQAAAFLSLSR